MMRRSWRIASKNSSYLTLQLEKEIEIEVLIFLLAISPQKAACTDTCSPSLISRHHCTTQWSLMFGLSSLTCWVFTQEGSPTNPKIFPPWYYFLQLKRAWWYLWNCIEFEEIIAPCRVWLKWSMNRLWYKIEMQLLEYDHALELVVFLNCYHEAISLKAFMRGFIVNVVNVVSMQNWWRIRVS